MRRRLDFAWVEPVPSSVGQLVFGNLVRRRRPEPDDFGRIAIVAAQPVLMQRVPSAVSDNSRWSTREGAEDRDPCAGCPPLRERNRERLRPAMVRYAAWNAAISAAADWRETVAAGASGAS
jgi:hypothetical protein